MLEQIKISIDAIGELLGELTDENPETAKKFYDALPIDGVVSMWGDEIYFSLTIEIERENPRVVVKEGEIAIWIENPSLCIFFGKTPVSTDTEIRAYSEVNVIGHILGDAKVFKQAKKGDLIKITKAQ